MSFSSGGSAESGYGSGATATAGGHSKGYPKSTDAASCDSSSSVSSFGNSTSGAFSATGRAGPHSSLGAHSDAASATLSSSSSSATSLGSDGGVAPRDSSGYLSGTQKGDGTYYAVGLGACGITNVATDMIAAISHQAFDGYPGADPSNPNKNPICGKKVNAHCQYFHVNSAELPV